MNKGRILFGHTSNIHTYSKHAVTDLFCGKHVIALDHSCSVMYLGSPSQIPGQSPSLTSIEQDWKMHDCLGI